MRPALGEGPAAGAMLLGDGHGAKQKKEVEERSEQDRSDKIAADFDLLPKLATALLCQGPRCCGPSLEFVWQSRMIEK